VRHQYQVITCGKKSLIIDSQTIAEKLGKPQEIAKANRIIQIVAATPGRFNFYKLYNHMEDKYIHITDLEERKRIISQGCNKFMKDYAPIYDKFMEDYRGDSYRTYANRNVRRQQECVGWNPEENVPGEHMHK
jgi:hypothetical protein